jgi:hypothetical protein
LEPIWPNPTTSDLGISFFLPSRQPVTIELIDAAGRRLGRLIQNSFPSGWTSLTRSIRVSQGDRFSPGVYYIRMSARGFTVARPIIVLR